MQVYEVEGRIILRSGFRKEVQGVPIDLSAEEAADLTEALLRASDEDTRRSIIESVLGISVKNDLIRQAVLNDSLAPKEGN